MEIVRHQGMYRGKNVLKISWITNHKCIQFLNYGTDSNDLNTKVMANSSLLPDFKDKDNEDVYVHTVILDSLDSDTVYYYEYGGDIFVSSVNHFRAPKQKRAEYKLLLVSNLDFSEESTIMIDTISKLVDKSPSLYDAFIDLGSDVLIPQNSSAIQSYFDKLSKITSKIPYHGLNKANPMVKEYLGRQEKENEIFYLQTDTSQIVFLDTDMVFEDTSIGIEETEKATLDNTVEKFNGWRFLLSDRPLYCSGSDSRCKKYSERMKSVYENVIINNHFSMVISGGASQYERTHPVSNTKIDSLAKVSQLRNLKKPIYLTVNGPVKTKNADSNVWTAKSFPESSFGELTIYDESSFRYSQYDIQGNVVDHFSVSSNVKITHRILLWVIYGFITVSLILLLALFYNLEMFCSAKKHKTLHNDELSDEGTDEANSTIQEDSEEYLDLPTINRKT